MNKVNAKYINKSATDFTDAPEELAIRRTSAVTMAVDGNISANTSTAFLDATGDSLLVNLPDPATVSTDWRLTCVALDVTNSVLIGAFGSAEIRQAGVLAASTVELTVAYQSITFVTDGTHYYVV